MNSYIQILRPLNGTMSVIAVYIGAIVAGAVLMPSEILIYGMAVVFLISSAGMIINDIADIDVDRINRPKRPLPSGRIGKKTAYVYAGLLFVVGNALAFYINQTILIVALVASALLIAYAAKLKKIIMAGHITISILVGITFIYGGLIAQNYMPTLMLAVLAFLSNVGREVFKTIDDVMGDKAANIETIAIKYGVFKAKLVASIFLLIAVGMSFLPFILGIFNEIYLFFVLIADIAFVASIVVPMKYGSKICKIAMIIALVSFIVGALA